MNTIRKKQNDKQYTKLHKIIVFHMVLQQLVTISSHHKLDPFFRKICVSTFCLGDGSHGRGQDDAQIVLMEVGNDGLSPQRKAKRTKTPEGSRLKLENGTE